MVLPEGGCGGGGITVGRQGVVMHAHLLGEGLHLLLCARESPQTAAPVRSTQAREQEVAVRLRTRHC
jgi:hypothetical protein